MSRIFLEAENFDNPGGWVIDQQSIGRIGSSYLMAHGLGVPVEDARTTCIIPEDGIWSIWVRTRDWTSVWNRGESGGRFNLLVNGETMPVVLGTNGPEWDWQKAGSIKLQKGKAIVALHDLTGFNGRCDAVYLSNEPDVPPKDPVSLEAFRRRLTGTRTTDDDTMYDLAVAGGGVAGICTAFAAVQSGLKVVLIHDREVLGGCNSSEIRVSMGGLHNAGPFPGLGNVVKAIEPIMGSGRTYAAGFYEDSRKTNLFRLLPDDRYRLALNESVVDVEPEPEDATAIRALVSQNVYTGERTRFRARFFADCTGDAVVARKMRAEVMYGQEGADRFGESLAPPEDTRQVMGMSILWRSKEENREVQFPDIDWGVEIDESNAYHVRGGDWEWECGQYHDQADDTEYIRDYGLMTVFANWSFLKNRSRRRDEWSKAAIEWITPIGGKRESYRVIGDVVLTQNDIENRIDFPDKTAAMTWNIDLHFPDPENEEKFDEPFRSCAYHRGIIKEYPVPYRCLYAKDLKNVFLGGRIVSASHIAFSCLRVMRTLGALGEVIGMAASICIRENADPRDVYTKHLDELIEMMQKGVEIPSYHGWPCDDSESYHFKDTGHISIHPNYRIPHDDRELCARIRKLNIPHRARTPDLPH